MEKGFTLLELLATIIVLGILSAIIIPKVTNAKDSARNSKKQIVAELIAKETISAHKKYLFSEEENKDENNSCNWMNEIYFELKNIESIECLNNVSTIITKDDKEYTAIYSIGKMTVKGGKEDIVVTITQSSNTQS